MSEVIERRKVLVVDDEPVSLAMASGMLEEQYEVLAGAASGEEALRRIRAEQPDLVLTDIVMPGMSGLEMCSALKGDETTREIPVIFMSGAMSLDEFLAGHAAGGEDFLEKPFQPAGLRHIVAQTLHNIDERRRLALDVQSAFSTAMVAMSSAAEIGVVLNFIRKSFACQDYVGLADAVVAACAEFGLNACVRLRGRGGLLARNRNGTSSTLEKSILERMAGFGRIIDFSHRTAISYDRVTLMITDMPRDDVERYGRLRDHLAILAESVDARVSALDDRLQVETKNAALSNLVQHSQAALADIDRRHRDNQNDARMIMHNMLGTVEVSFAQLGLTTAQEDYLAGVMRDAVQQVMDLFDQGLSIDNHLTAVKEMLEKGNQPPDTMTGG